MTLEFIKKYTCDIKLPFNDKELELLNKCCIISHYFSEGSIKHQCYNRCCYPNDCQPDENWNNYGCYESNNKLVLKLSGQYVYKLILYYDRLHIVSYNFIKYLNELPVEDPIIDLCEKDYSSDQDEDELDKIYLY